MRRTLFAGALLLASSLVLLPGCVRTEPLPDLTGPNASAEPLRFRLPTWPDGAVHDLSSDRGNVVILDVWATWCEPCRDALVTWEQVGKEYGARGLRVYAINVDEDPNLVRAFLDETKVTLPVLIDKGASVSESLLKVSIMPTSFFVDRRGVIRFVHQGFAEEHLQRYQSELEELLNERP